MWVVSVALPTHPIHDSSHNADVHTGTLSSCMLIYVTLFSQSISIVVLRLFSITKLHALLASYILCAKLWKIVKSHAYTYNNFNDGLRQHSDIILILRGQENS